MASKSAFGVKRKEGTPHPYHHVDEVDPKYLRMCGWLFYGFLFFLIICNFFGNAMLSNLHLGPGDQQGDSAALFVRQRSHGLLAVLHILPINLKMTPKVD